MAARLSDFKGAFRTRVAWAVCALGGIFLPPALVFAGLLPPVACLVAVSTALVTLIWLIRDHAPAILLVFVAVALGAIVVSRPGLNLKPPEHHAGGEAVLTQQWLGKGPFDERLPIVVHIILDEMMSPGAVESDLRGGEALRSAIYGFGRRHGFRVFDSVYSRFFFSGETIPNMVNAEFAGKTAREDLWTTIRETVPENLYFAEMRRRGYRTAVFQTTLLDFCQALDVALCQTFQSFDPAHGNAETQDLNNRVVALSQTLLRARHPSYFSQYGQRLLAASFGVELQRDRSLGSDGRYDAHGFPVWFDRFAAFVEGVPRGSHVFAHFMVPHSPYVLTENCIVGGRADSGYYLGQRFENGQTREAARREFYASYFRQMHCVLSRLNGLMGSIAGIPEFRDATIVIHGDHGSRISVGNFIEDYTSRDLIDNYATFFAVKRPGTLEGIDCTFESLGNAFRAALGPSGSSDPGPVPPTVFASTQAGTETTAEAPMPLFGCAAHR